MGENTQALLKVLLRILAVFTASGLSVIGAGAIVGVDTFTAVLLAGTLGVAQVVEKLARAYLADGRLTLKEMNDIFSSTNKPEVSRSYTKKRSKI